MVPHGSSCSDAEPVGQVRTCWGWGNSLQLVRLDRLPGSPQHDGEDVQGEEVVAALHSRRGTTYALVASVPLAPVRIGRLISVTPRALEDFIGPIETILGSLATG